MSKSTQRFEVWPISNTMTLKFKRCWSGFFSCRGEEEVRENAAHPLFSSGTIETADTASRGTPSYASSIQERPVQLLDPLEGSSRDPLNLARFKDPLNAPSSDSEQRQ